jgi:hypothetical protein
LPTGSQDSPCIRVSIFWQRIILRNAGQDGTDSSSVGIPPVSQKRKTSELSSKLFLGREKPSKFCSKPFLEGENSWNSIPNRFSEEKNPQNSVPNHFWMRKTSEFCAEPFLDEKNLGILFRTISGREKTSKFRSESFSEEKKLRNSVPNHFWKRKNFGKDNFC